MVFRRLTSFLFHFSDSGVCVKAPHRIAGGNFPTLKFQLYPKIYVPLGGRQRNYSGFIKADSLQVDFNMN